MRDMPIALRRYLAVVAMVLSTPLSALSDRFGRLRLLLGGYIAYAGVDAALGLLSHTSPGLFVAFAAYGVFLAATEGVEKALVADLAPAHHQGTAFGWFNLTAGLMLLLAAGLLVGWVRPVVATRKPT
jgi:MFS family permease